MIDTVRDPEPLGIVPIHASAVQLDGDTLVFLGPSGAGKSTIRRLLHAFARPLADDRVYLIPQEGGEWAVADAGNRILEGRLSEQEAAALEGPPLRAILRLSQDSKPRLEPMDALQTCRHLTNAFFDLYWHRNFKPETKRVAFASLATIARSVPGYRLHFDRSPQTIEVIMEASFHRHAAADSWDH
jgi:hypothetical protein